MVMMALFLQFEFEIGWMEEGWCHGWQGCE